MSVAVVTDSNSGITQAEARELGISVLPMPFYINGELYFEDITLTQKEFYRFLIDDAEISTSQPAPGDVTDLWNQMLDIYDEVVYIPMSSGLSGSCQTAMLLAEDYDGRVQVVDNQRISVTQRQSVLDAMELARRGKSAAEIKKILEEVKFSSSIYITVETLHFLKKGGRITPTAAAIGTLLNLKPVLQIQGEKLDAYSKCRGKKMARKTMLDAIAKDCSTRFADAAAKDRIHYAISYSGNPEEAEDWLAEVKRTLGRDDVYSAPLSLSISCHIGYGALAVTATEFLPEDI